MSPESLVVGLVEGPPALGVLGDAWSVQAMREQVLNRGLTPRVLRLGQADQLAELWETDIVFMLCDGAYPEVGGGVSLAALYQWCCAGGVLVEPAASAFLLASTGGRLTPSIRGFMDVFGIVVDTNGTDQPIRATPPGTALLPEPLPATLLDLNRGSARRATLNAALAPTTTYVIAGGSACLFGDYDVGRGHLLRWSAANCGSVSAGVRTAMFRLAAGRAQALRPRDVPLAIIGPVSTAGLETDVVTIWSNDVRERRLRLLLDGVPVGAWDGPVAGQASRLRLPSRIDVAADAALLCDDSLLASATVVSTRVDHPADLPSGDEPTLPEDFARFWSDQRRSADVGWRTSLTRALRARSDSVVITRVHCPGANPESSRAQALGTLARPADLQRRAPAVLVLPGYGCASEEEVPERLAERGLVALTIGFGEIEPCAGAPHNAGLLSEDPDDPRRFGYRDVVLKCLAAMDFLSSLPFVDARRIGVLGASQGGGLAVLTAALHPRVSAVASLVPFLCDVMRSQAVMHTEPYAEIRRWLADHPDREGHLRSCMQYYDAANAAQLIRVPALVMWDTNDEVVHSAAVRTLCQRFSVAPELLVTNEGHLAPALLSRRLQVESWLHESLESAASGPGEPISVPSRAALTYQGRQRTSDPTGRTTMAST